MNITKKNASPRYQSEGITSYLLVSEITTNSRYITTSLVEMNPGGKQHIHSHETEQCYYILEGEGLMTVGRETQKVAAGDCIFIPSNEPHALNNNSQSVLKYFSADSSLFGREKPA
ncbi:MAG: cupin domain-containing protein [Sedimentisphaerales bacterium]